MKPLKLTMCAFGSYGKETVIDFTEVHHGLFLITGDTGSGKTTIFDGITFAIYGETSGGKRDGKMMRSQFASPADETFVELTFSYRGEIYTVRRSPEYMREKKRGNGLVKAAASVELTLPDKTVFRGKLKETDKKLCEIMGIDREQFTQIAMIAQGDFLRLLHAKSEDRKKVFSTIFHTDIYRKVEEELGEKRRELKEKTDGMSERMRVYVRGIRVPEGQKTEEESVLQAAERLTVLKECENPEIPAVKEVLNLFVKVQNRILFCLETPLLEAEMRYGKLSEQVGLAKSNNDMLDSFKKAKHVLAEKESQESEYAARKLLLEQSGRAYGIKHFEDRRKEARIQMDTAKARAAASEEWAEHTWEEFLVFLDSLESPKFPGNPAEAGERQTSGLRLKYEGHTKLVSLISDWKARAKTLESDAEKKRELEKKSAQIEKEERLCRKKQEELEEDLKMMTEAGELYGKLQEQFFCEQAGILARERLAFGKPCPVCGSLEHPAPAVLPEDAVTEEQVRQAQKCLEDQRAVCETKSLEIRGEVSRISEVKKQLAKAMGELPENPEERQRLLKNVIRAAEQFERARETFEKDKEEERRFGELWIQAGREFEAARMEAGFIEEGAYLEAVSRWKTKKDLESERAENEQYFTELHGLRTAVAVLEEQVQGKTYTDLSALGEELEGQKEKRDSLLTEKEKASACRQSYETLLKTLEDEEKQYSRILEQFLLYDGLWQAAGGKIKGRVRMDFETYVQRMYFEKILAAANRRFLTFTDGKMKLKSRPVENLGLVGAAGLELNVYVMATGKERDVKTLSGGESFLASLALALGLSDVVQSQAGSIRLESMFVDEGFGALDDETRNQAVRVLNELAGDDRLVGIISHVNDLKDSIERQLTVTRTMQGSQAVWNKGS